MSGGRWPGGAGAETVMVGGKTYLTTAGAAKMLGVSLHFVRRVAKRGVGAEGVGLVPVRASSARQFLFTREAVWRYANAEPLLLEDGEDSEGGGT